MRVIPPPESNWKMVVACDECDSGLEIEKDDVGYKDFYSGTDAEMSMEYYLVCPVCGQYVFLDEKKLPKDVKYAARAKYAKCRK